MTTSNVTHMTEKGFTLVEVVTAFGLILILLTITGGSLFRAQQRTSLSETVRGLIRDLRQQQIFAMQGVADDGVRTDFSVRFETDRYILFPGIVYSAGNPQNRTVYLEPSMRFTDIDVPDDTITFSRGSGDVRNYSTADRSVTLSQDDTGSTEVVTVNERGVVFH